MPITDRLVLPVDVEIRPFRDLPPALRKKLRGRGVADGYAITRPRGRHSARLIDAEGAALLSEFRAGRLIAEAVAGYAARGGHEPASVLESAFPLLRECFNQRWLVPVSSPDAAPILPTRDVGDRIGPYHVLRCLGLMDDTEVYLARAKDGSHAMIKLVRPAAAADLNPRIAREAASLRHLGGRGAPGLLARGRFVGRPWLAMSWCAGVSPDHAAAEARLEGQPGRPRALVLAERIARAYATLHRNGVIHSDVHPRNLLIDAAGEVTLLDFGCAHPILPLRLAGRRGTGAVPAYLAPEIARALLAGKRPPPPSVAAEQYAVAALLYQVMTGTGYLDFDLERSRMLTQIVHDPPRAFAERGAAPWPEVEAILRRALAKDPGYRFPSLDSLADALCDVTSGSRAAPSHMCAAPELVDGFLDRVRLDGDTLRDWPEGTRPPSASVTFGSAGIAYAICRLACRRRESALLALADVWCTQAERAIGEEPGACYAPEPELDASVLGPVSPYHAASGVHLVRALIALASGDGGGARRAVRLFRDACMTDWDNHDLTLGWAGVLTGTALLVDALPTRGSAGTLAREHGDRVFERLLAAMEARPPVGEGPDPDLGLAHGWAGMLSAALRWCSAAGCDVPDAVVRRLGELAARAEPSGRGVRWRQWGAGLSSHPAAGTGIAGWCNGPAGFIHLWVLADRLLRQTGYRTLAEGSGWATWEARSASADLCCGLAGRAYALLTLARHTGSGEWVDRARTLGSAAAALLERNRAGLPRPLSLYRGEAGVAVLLDDLASPESAAMPLFEPER